MNTTVYQVGKPFPHNLPSVTDGAISEFLRPNGNQLLITLRNISQQELDLLIHGEVSVGLHCEPESGGLMLVWGFKQGNEELIFDTVLDARIINDIKKPTLEHEQARMPIHAIVVDPMSKLIAGMRFFTLHPELTKKMVKLIETQLTFQGDPQALDRWVYNLMQYPISSVASSVPYSFEVGV